MGTNILSFYKNRIKNEWKIAFYCAFLSCLLIHIYKFTNTLPNHDSLYNAYADQNMIQSGRWFLQYACGISSYFDLPWINGLLSAVYLGLTAVVITEVFDLKNPFVIALTAALITASPCTTETFFFEFTSDGYFLGLLLSSLGAYFACKKSGIRFSIISILLISLSCSIYQSYISFSVVLCILYITNHLINRTITPRIAWKRLGRLAFLYAIATITYYAIWKLLLRIAAAQPTAYHGIDTIGNFNANILWNGAVKSVKNLFIFFLEWNIFEHPITLYGILNLSFLLAFTLVLGWALYKSGTFQKPGRFLTVLSFLSACIPIISLWNFASASLTYRPMMMHSVCLFYVFSLILFDKWVPSKMSTSFGILISIIIFNFSIMANISYYYLDRCYEKTYHTGSQIMARIEEQDLETIRGITFIGNKSDSVSISDIFPASKIHLLSNLLESDLCYDDIHTYLFLKNTFGLNIPRISDAERDLLLYSEEVTCMESWPSKEAINVIDGILIIKLSNNTES